MIVSHYLNKIGYRPRGIVHVGAHLADEMEHYIECEPNLIVWIEAFPKYANYIRGLIQNSNFDKTSQKVIEALVADSDGDKRDFFVFSNEGASSSIFRSTALLRETWPGVKETGEKLSLTTSRLDTALMANGVNAKDIDVLVFDIQGAEALAIKGAGVYLDSAMFVETEVSRASIYEGAPLVDEVISLMEARSFYPCTPIPWHGDVVFSRVASDPARGDSQYG